MHRVFVTLAIFTLALFSPSLAFAQGGGECPNGLCGTPNQSGGAGGGSCVAGICSGGCGSVLVAMTDRGDTYQFADDFDGDGIEDEFDNCPFVTNYAQVDTDADSVGDTCDLCVSLSDPFQADIDGDGLGDLCDLDLDGDSIANDVDNCATTPNAAQVNTDADAEGDACDRDDDNDGIDDWTDPCRLLPGGAHQTGCDDDVDGDGIPGSDDNCPSIFNPGLDTDGLQNDVDGDGFGDSCDLDIDGDEVANFADNCIDVHNPSQIDLDHDEVGDAGNWSGGAESCDSTECYVVGGDVANCLDPSTAFAIYLALVGDRTDGVFQVGDEITTALFSNRLGRLHTWTARFSELPGDSDAIFENGRGAAATLEPSPQVASCLRPNDRGGCDQLNTIRFTPDAPGTYAIKVTATLAYADPMGRTTASYTIVAEVEGEPLGGCAAAQTSGLFALALGLLVLTGRRRR